MKQWLIFSLLLAACACSSDTQNNNAPDSSLPRPDASSDMGVSSDGSADDGTDGGSDQGRDVGEPPPTDSCQLMVPLSTDPPDTTLFPRITHPRPPSRLADAAAPTPTNHFMTNVILEPASEALYVHPYVLKLAPSGGVEISHADDVVLGDTTAHGSARFYFNAFANDVQLSTTDGVGDATVVGYDEVSVHLQWSDGAAVKMEMPVVRGMAYVTMKYLDATPRIETVHAVTEVNGSPPADGETFSGSPVDLRLNSGERWRIYTTDTALQWTYNAGQLTANMPTSSVVRVAKVPNQTDAAAAILDAHSATYPTGAELTAAVNDQNANAASYSFAWNTEGGDAVDLLHYAYAHHQQTLSQASLEETELEIRSTTKGAMRAYVGDRWTLREPKMTAVSWMPPRQPSVERWAEILPILEQEIEEAFTPPGGSFYFAGKALYKRAVLCLMADTHGETELRDTCIEKLRSAYEPFVTNAWDIGLRYDETWGGVVSAGGLDGDPIADFGNSYYNDHHYHWGYFVSAAAILRKLDPAWGQTHADWVETLIRDVANPSSLDTSFPTTRAFDWFAGHSWSQGLFSSADGKDQESTSEEINFHYGAMLWGLVSDNDQLYQLSRLMLAVASRAINTYFLIADGSDIHPPEFADNHVTGIFFENKCDYATWFGSNPEFIHGIQMLPMTPVTEEVRFSDFVAQEWELLDELAPTLTSGWKSVLYTNYAIAAPDEAYEALKDAPLDDGLTRSWALYWAATRPEPGTVARPGMPASDDGYADWLVPDCP